MCDHVFDGGYCLECNEAQQCALCEENDWNSRCDICDGDRIYENCYNECELCGQNVCIVCEECDCI